MADLPAHFKLALELSPELETFTHLLLKAPIDRTERDVQQIAHYLVTTMQNPYFVALAGDPWILAELCREVQLTIVCNPGDVIFHEGDLGYAFYVILDGQCVVWSRREEQRGAIRGKGNTSALFDKDDLAQIISQVREEVRTHEPGSTQDTAPTAAKAGHASLSSANLTASVPDAAAGSAASSAAVDGTEVHASLHSLCLLIADTLKAARRWQRNIGRGDDSGVCPEELRLVLSQLALADQRAKEVDGKDLQVLVEQIQALAQMVERALDVLVAPVDISPPRQGRSLQSSQPQFSEQQLLEITMAPLGNRIVSLDVGTGFGEVALSMDGGGSRRTASITCSLERSCLMLAIPKVLYNRLLKQRDAVILNRKLDALTSHAFFAGWKRKSLVRTTLSTEIVTMKYGSTVVSKGMPTEMLFLLVTGGVKLVTTVDLAAAAARASTTAESALALGDAEIRMPEKGQPPARTTAGRHPHRGRHSMNAGRLQGRAAVEFALLGPGEVIGEALVLEAIDGAHRLGEEPASKEISFNGAARIKTFPAAEADVVCTSETTFLCINAESFLSQVAVMRKSSMEEILTQLRTLHQQRLCMRKHRVADAVSTWCAQQGLVVPAHDDRAAKAAAIDLSNIDHHVGRNNSPSGKPLLLEGATPNSNFVPVRPAGARPARSLARPGRSPPAADADLTSASTAMSASASSPPSSRLALQKDTRDQLLRDIKSELHAATTVAGSATPHLPLAPSGRRRLAEDPKDFSHARSRYFEQVVSASSRYLAAAREEMQLLYEKHQLRGNGTRAVGTSSRNRNQLLQMRHSMAAPPAAAVTVPSDALKGRVSQLHRTVHIPSSAEAHSAQPDPQPPRAFAPWQSALVYRRPREPVVGEGEVRALEGDKQPSLAAAFDFLSPKFGPAPLITAQLGEDEAARNSASRVATGSVSRSKYDRARAITKKGGKLALSRRHTFSGSEYGVAKDDQRGIVPAPSNVSGSSTSKTSSARGLSRLAAACLRI